MFVQSITNFKLMTTKIRIALAIVMLVSAFAVSGCANMNWGTSAGIDVHWGPHGPRIDPHVNVGLYGGGRFY